MSILFGTNLENAKAFLKVRFSSVQAITNLRLVANFSVFFFLFFGTFLASTFVSTFHRSTNSRRERLVLNGIDPLFLGKSRKREIDGVYVQLFNAILQ